MNPQKTTLCPGTFTESVPGILLFFVFYLIFSGSIIRTSAQTRNPHDGDQPAITYNLSGNVFEDINYGGGAGRSKATCSGISRSNARVEIYNASGVFQSFATTDVNGDYSFTGLDAGDYHIRVVNASVTSSRSGYTTSCLPVQTYRTDATSGTAMEVSDYVGGTDPTVADPGNGSSGTTFNTSTFVFTAILTGTAQSVTIVVIGSADITGIDFGFSFNTIVNINNTGQGSLRQFITNANTLGNTGLALTGQPAGQDVSIFMISDGNAHPGLRTGLTNQLSNGVATITLTTALPDITASSTSLNGTTQTTNVGNTNAGEVGTGGTVGVDAVSLPQYPRPEVAINASWTGSRYAALTLSGTVSDILLQGFAMYNGRHLITITSGNGTNRVIRNMLVGTLPDGADPGSLRNNGMGVRVTSVSSCTVDQCYVGWNGESGILGTSTASVMTVTYCEAFGNGWNSNGHDGIDIDGINSTIQYNLSHNNTNNTGTPQPGAGNGIECGSSGLGGSNNTLVENNTSRNNTTSGLTIRAGVNNITVRKNIFSYNPVGILVSRESANTNNHFITMNSTFANTNLGIDLVLSASTGDGITPNNGTKDVSYPNYDMDFPVFTSAGISGTTLTVAGYVGSAPGQSTFGNARVEIFKSDDHASGNGEGKNYLGYLTTDANGNLSGSISVSGWIDGDKITGTASDGSGNTSEFGPNFTVFICPVTPGAITGTTAQCPALTGQVYSISSVPGATTYNWTVPTGWSITGGQAATSVTVTTGSAGQNGNISVTAGNTCGTSPESSLAVTVVAVPTITGTTPGSRCGTGTVGLGASASAGIINWYSASTGGSSLGTGISFTTPSILTTTTYYVDATANGCTTASRTAVTATVSNIPVAPTLSVASPTTGSSICAGYNSGTVTGNAGTGGGTGAVDEYQVSINGGSSYSAYTSGNAINTSGAAGSVIVQSRRTGGTGTNCTTTAWSTICTWTIASAPTAPTLSAANPTNGSTICSGFNIGTVTGTGGSGGSTGAANEYQVSINGGSTYSAYTSGSAINTSSATGSVIVQSRRTAGSYGCTASSWSTICTWTANAVEVNATVGGSACYATLLAAFAAINLGTHQDVITININGNTTEAASAVINASGTGGASYSSITIQPNGGACIVSGNIAGALIDLNGANNVTIDGLNSGGNSLAIRNTNTSGTASTIRFIADASNNTITNCTIEGSGTGPAYGTIFFSAGTTTGNDNNTVSLNTIKPAGSNLHLNAIYSAGSSGVTDNSGITISGNNIQDYFNAGTNGSSGILVFSNSSDWNITGNRFFQTSPRACSAALTHRAIAVLTGQGYVITDNIIGFINSGGTGKTTYTGSYGYMFRGIELTVGTGEVTSVQGNTVSGISIASSTAIALPGAFSGITILAGAVDIGGINGNTIGGAMGTDAIAVTSATTLTNISGIYSTTTSNVSIQNNIIGAINTGTGVAAIGYIFYGIYSAGTGSYTISSNTIGSTGTANAIAIGTLTVTTSGVCTFNGINNAATGTISITGNTIQNCTAYGTGASVFNGILNSAAGSSTTLDVTQNNIIAINNTGTGASTGISVTAATAAVLNITGNRILSCSITGTTGFTAISNVSAVAATTISENTIRNIVRSTTTGAVTGISSTGAVTAFLNINDNQFGNGDGGLVTYTAANSSALAGITVTTATANCELYIQRNDFRGIIHNVQGSSAHTYIINAATTKKQEIINNTFTDLEVNTTGAVIFISNSVVLPANATQTVSENKIVTATIPAPEFYFKKTGAGGTVTLFTSTAATTAAGVAVNHINNDFSKISITGATTMAGWVHTDAGGQSVKTFTGNSFSNWTGGSSAITVLTVSGGANGSGVVSGNTMSNISGGAAITGIVTGSGNEIFSSNTINDLTSSGAAAVTGISVTAGTYRKISRNKIYNLTASITGGTVNGILVSGTTTGIQVQIDNNLIGDLSTPNSSAVDPVRAISVTNTGTNSSIYVYYNTIYLNSASTGANFGSTGVYHTVSATATTAALTLRNNIIINQSVPSGTGITAAYRRSGTSLNNFTLASNNNLFHAGAPSSTRLVFYDGTNSAQTLGEYQAMVGPTRETFSVYEDLISGSKFKSVIGANGTYLHLDPLKSTLAFNSAVNISGITEDFDGAIRQGNPGYFGDETAPDIGADEVNTGFQPSALSGVYNVGTGQLFTSLTNDGGLFATINSLGLGGNVTVNITSDLIEDGNNPLNQWNETGTGNYTLTIIPGAAVQRLVSCNLNNGFIRFNGADRVTIDGSFNGSGNYLIFRNTNTNSSASVFLFANDASGNTVKNSTMEGSCIGTTSGIVIFSTGTSTGNDDNTISNNI
ncbi:MAG: hypothetical protein Q8M08_10540, partial [Bacteroidales bacterium]|nr:hypothetical protein [Bacteroidales bacterium]